MALTFLRIDQRWRKLYAYMVYRTWNIDRGNLCGWWGADYSWSVSIGARKWFLQLEIIKNRRGGLTLDETKRKVVRLGVISFHVTVSFLWKSVHTALDCDNFFCWNYFLLSKLSLPFLITKVERNCWCNWISDILSKCFCSCRRKKFSSWYI